MKFTMMRLSIIIFTVLFAFPVQHGQGQCVYGKHPSVAASSCREVLDMQPECYGESGVFWLGEAGEAEEGSDSLHQRYCDLQHQGGGWLRVFSHRQDVNSSCPLAPGGTKGWKEEWFNETHLYCQRGDPSEGYAPYVQWNADRTEQYSEIRGYVNLRMKSGSLNKGDGFASGDLSLDQDYMDGVAIEMPVTPLRHVFSYVIGSIRTGTSSYRCPDSGGKQPPSSLPPYYEGSFACDQFDPENEALDEGGYYTSELYFSGEHFCTQCKSGQPWFKKTLGEITDAPLQFRIVDGTTNDWGISVADMEVYVR